MNMHRRRVADLMAIGGGRACPDGRSGAAIPTMRRPGNPGHGDGTRSLDPRPCKSLNLRVLSRYPLPADSSPVLTVDRMTGTATPLRPRIGRVLLAASALLLAGCSGDYPQTTFEPVTEFGEQINRLFYNTTAWTMAILFIVEAVLLYVLFRFRARPDSPEPKQIHGNTVIEIIWTVIPAVIVALIAIPAVGAIFEIQRPKDEGAFEVTVIGHQWWWEFQYPELPGVITANEMHVP